MSPTVRKGIAKAEEKKAEADAEKKKSDAMIKESEERSKRKKEKKKAKPSKDLDGGDHISSVAKSQDHIRRGKVFQYGKGSSFATGGGISNTTPCHSDLLDTDVPGDEDFLVEWDEWSEIEKGRGPMATWE